MLVGGLLVRLYHFLHGKSASLVARMRAEGSVSLIVATIGPGQVSVMFGVTSAIVIPFGDLCSGLPKVGEVPVFPWHSSTRTVNIAR